MHVDDFKSVLNEAKSISSVLTCPWFPPLDLQIYQVPHMNDIACAWGPPAWAFSVFSKTGNTYQFHGMIGGALMSSIFGLPDCDWDSNSAELVAIINGIHRGLEVVPKPRACPNGHIGALCLGGSSSC
eukprot:5656179-Karenia_brevis.AAC.1